MLVGVSVSFVGFVDSWTWITFPPMADFNLSFTWALIYWVAAFLVSIVNVSLTFCVNIPSYILDAKNFTKSSSGLFSCVWRCFFIKLTYFNSPAAFSIDSRSNADLVSFFISGMTISSKSRRLISRNGFSSILFGASKSVKNLYSCPFVSIEILALVTWK